MEKLLCSTRDCKKKFKQVDNMSFKELTYYNNKCKNCGVWLIKNSIIANKTYKKVSNCWAVKFNQKLCE